jgi:two-component system chemotaxis sensor kinase CheA
MLVPRPTREVTSTLPFTLASTRCLLVCAGEQTLAIPLAAVERMVAVGAEDVFSVAGKEAIRYQGQPLALARLADILRLEKRGPAFNGQGKAPAVILSAGGQRIAFLVDELRGEEELLVKSLGRQLSRVPNIAGATILGSGRVILILNAADLIKSAQQAAASVAPAVAVEQKETPARPTILIVDDSITTRTLEKNILTTAGYDVRLAYDGQEAIAALTEGPCDLVVADVDMPRMDGFELTRRLKEDERYRDLPVILVTSLGSAEHKARGIAVGADAYIVKSSFDQDNLLETIRQLI